jgi:WD40 repeat protein
VKGNVCTLDMTCDKLKFIGNYGSNLVDAILGLVWLKSNPNKFISGSSYGKIICSDIRNDFKSTPNLSSGNFVEYPTFDKLTSIHVNSNSDRLLVSGHTNGIKILDIETAATITSYDDIHSNYINISRYANLSPNLLVTSSFDCTAKSWDTRINPKSPIYTIKCETGIVMINFSSDDRFLLASALDNEIIQFLTIDGSKHMRFDIPSTGLQSNFTRSYYTSSGAYIIAGGCEESVISLLSTSTGKVVRRFEMYPGRQQSGLYAQVSYYL